MEGTRSRSRTSSFTPPYGFDENGRSLGRLRSTGLRPKFLEKLAHANVTVDPMIFCDGWDLIMGYQSARWCRGIEPAVALTVGLLALPQSAARGGGWSIDHVEPGGRRVPGPTHPRVDAEMDLTL